MTLHDLPQTGSHRLPRLTHATVADVMHHGVCTCGPETSLVGVARIMATRHIHAVVVLGVEGGPGGERLRWGVLSDLDLLSAAREDRLDTTAGAAIATPVVTVSPEDPLPVAVDLMTERHVSHLIVVDAHTGRPSGVLSSLDIAGVIAWGEA